MTENVGFVIGRIDRVIRKKLSQQLGPLGLTPPEYTVLALLHREPGMSGAEVARRTLVSPQAVNELIASLERRMMIERSVDPRHGRVLKMRLTGAGSDALASARAEVEAFESELLDGIAPDERARLLELLWKCAGNIGAGVVKQR